MTIYELLVTPGREEDIARHHVSVAEVEAVVFSLKTMPAPEDRQRADSARRSKSRIPRFSSIDEEAAFWDSHDSAEFEDEFEEVTDVQFVKAQPKKSITVRLEHDAFAALARRAKEKGVGSSTLVRTWILEQLRQPEKPPS